jgi:PIN domain nuclease of toxin-antitoxin system
MLIALTEPERLPAKVRRVLLRGTNVLSVVSYWEVLLKSMKGTLRVGDPRSWWQDAIEQLAGNPLTLRPDHVSEISGLPPIHKDPFDRVLIAQAVVEDLDFVTLDAEIRRYASTCFRVVSGN